MQKDKDNAGESHSSTRDFKFYPSMAEKSGPVVFLSPKEMRLCIMQNQCRSFSSPDDRFSNRRLDSDLVIDNDQIQVFPSVFRFSRFCMEIILLWDCGPAGKEIAVGICMYNALVSSVLDRCRLDDVIAQCLCSWNRYFDCPRSPFRWIDNIICANESNFLCFYGLVGMDVEVQR